MAPKKKPIKKKPAPKKAAPKKKKAAAMQNRIAILLDSSSSMSTMRKEAIDAFNAQIAEIRKGSATMDTKISLYTFADTVRCLFRNRPIDNVENLDEMNYVPSGVTSLYDAIGEATNDLSGLAEAKNENCSFLVVIVTDGQENNSKTHTYASVSGAIDKLQKTNRWTFTYLGCGAGLQDVGASLGISAGNTLTGTHLQAQGAYTLVATNAASAFMRSRAGGQSATASFYSGDATQATLTTQVTGKKAQKTKK